MEQEVSEQWTTAEIVYISISGILICMAFAEVIAFTGSLSYSFVKVHLKAKAAKQRGVQYLSIIVMLVFWALRILLLGAMFSLVPVPHWQGMSKNPAQNHQFIPSEIIDASRYIAFGLVGLLLIMPTAISIQQLVTSPSNIKEQLAAISTTSTFPRVLIVMPVYNELPEVLHVAICSAIDGDYPKEHLHIFISFDNDAVSELYRALIGNLGLPADGEWYPPVLDLYFRGVQITVSRFPHGGKRLTQKKTFGLINSIYKEYPDKTDHLFILFIDSDILLHPSTIANFVWDMQFRPGCKDLLAMTGVITVTTKTEMNFISLLQDIEYVHGQFIGRAIESALGGCVTLPGALTIFRYSAFLKSYDEYFAERTVSDLWDFGRSHLGEDRYLTHLLMTKAIRPKMIQYCHRATCKTEPVREWRNLMKQRRRWFLGFLTNEGAFLSDPHLWIKYPWLLAYRLIQDVLFGTSMLSYITIAAIASGMEHWSVVWLGLLAAYFFLNWGLMFTYGLWLGRYKALLYPIMFTVGPFVSWFLLVYGVITANERTWGGPRADAAADKKETLGGDGQGGDKENGEGEPSGFEGSQHDGDLGQNADSDQERIELPDYLFYPQLQQIPLTRSRHEMTFKASTDDTADHHVYDLDCHSDNPGSNVHDPSPAPLPGLGSSSLEDSKFCEITISQDEEESGDIRDESLDDASGDNALDGQEQDCGPYFSPQPSRPFNFASSQLLTLETQWWDDDKQLSSLGILPYLQQPKIPAMFASVETLVAIPSTASFEALAPRSIRSLSQWSSCSSLDILGREYPGEATIPGTPIQGSVYKSSKPKSTRGTPNPRSATSSSDRPTSMMSTPARGRHSKSIPDMRKHRSRSEASSRIPSPSPSFHYIPAEFLTPSSSTPATPKMSPLLLPSPYSSASRSTPGGSASPLSSPPTTSSRSVKSVHSRQGSPKASADILAAAALLATTANPSAVASSSQSSRSRGSRSRSRSRSRGPQLQATSTPVPAIPDLPLLDIRRNASVKSLQIPARTDSLAHLSAETSHPPIPSSLISATSSLSTTPDPTNPPRSSPLSSPSHASLPTLVQLSIASLT